MCLVSFSKKKYYNSLDKINKFQGSPTWGYIDITNACNHFCPWCYNGKPQNPIFMKLNDFKNILIKFSDIGIYQITITGGEPTLHPEFKKFVKSAKKFNLHIASNGDFISDKLAGFLAENNVKQVQFNFQGSRFHDKIHNVKGCYEKLKKSVDNVLKSGISAVTMTTIGDYLINFIDEIFREADELGIERIRVWEAAGKFGTDWMTNKDIKSIFEKCRFEAEKLGFIHSLSYEPLFDGDVNFKCPQLQNLILSVKTDGRITCGVAETVFDNTITNIFETETNEILKKYRAFNKKILGKKKAFCFARCSRKLIF
ncbi:MAG TPA: radical SAM protein [bacterium]|nr:radical SAM protein [bacterium]